jgi:hypothetical protein
MMLSDDMSKRLLSSAESIGWISAEVPAFVSSHFRGRNDDVEVALPKGAKGLRLGAYPILIVDMDLSATDAVPQQLQQVHNQMIIARSFMQASEVINAHIFLVATEPTTQADWIQMVDLIERDETVCRKLVWLRQDGNLDQSFQEFVERTFLAQPWAFADEQDNAPLDQNDKLVESVLRSQGLSAAAAAKWIELAGAKLDDPQELVEQLVSAMETLA